MPPPPMFMGYGGYPPPHHYPHLYVQHSPSYETMSTKLPSDHSIEYEEEFNGKENRTYIKGSILDKMLEEFYLGDEVLKKEDKKKKGSRWSLSKSTQK